MKSFKEFISEIAISAAIRAPFFIAVKDGNGYRIDKEVTVSDPDAQAEVLSKYDSKTCYIIPAKESSHLRIGDRIPKRNIRSLNGIPAGHFKEEVESLTEVTAKKKVRILKGKRVVQYRCPPGHHKRSRGSRTCVRTTGKRKYVVKKAAKKAARKRRARRTTITRKRNRSMRKRRGMGL